MSEDKKNIQERITYEDRLLIEQLLKLNYKLKNISEAVDKNKSTITFTTDKAFISITLSLDAKSELISHLYKKIPKRI